MSNEDITHFVKHLAEEFFDYTDNVEQYTYEDLVDISVELLRNGVCADEILYFLGIGYTTDVDISESIGGMFTTRSFNKSRRKFFTKSAAQLRKEAVIRRLKNIKNRTHRKMYYMQNRSKMSRYAKMYKTALRKHLHNKKLRRRS